DPPRFFFQMSRPPPSPTLFPYTTLFRSRRRPAPHGTDRRTTQASLGAKAEAMVSMSRTRTYLMTTRENLTPTRKELIRAGGRFLFASLLCTLALLHVLAQDQPPKEDGTYREPDLVE